jgi:chromosome segregation ATPase
MRIARRSFGVAVLTLSVLGLLLCLGGIVGAWIVKSRADAVGDTLLEATVDSLTFVDDKLDRVQQVLAKCQKPVGALSRAAQRLQRQEPRAQEELASTLQMLDDNVFQELQTARSWLDSTYAVAVVTGKASQAIVSSKYAASHPDALGIALAQQVQESADSISEIIVKLQAVRRELEQVRATSAVAKEIVLGILADLVDLETRLQRLDARIDGLKFQVADLRGDAEKLQRNFSWWTMAAALAMSLIPAWFGISQLVTIRQGWRQLNL